MNDYKELITDIAGAMLMAKVMGRDSMAKVYSRAADAIEQLAKDINVLAKERDSAIADFTIYVKHMEDGRKAFSCEFCNEENCNGCKHCSNFEWRGVQDGNGSRL